jgi:hypothetical protein
VAKRAAMAMSCFIVVVMSGGLMLSMLVEKNYDELFDIIGGSQKPSLCQLSTQIFQRWNQ